MTKLAAGSLLRTVLSRADAGAFRIAVNGRLNLQRPPVAQWEAFGVCRISAFGPKIACFSQLDFFPRSTINEGCCDKPKKLFLPGGFSKYIGLRYGGPPTGFHDAATRDR
jgi:hypothetical protein